MHNLIRNIFALILIALLVIGLVLIARSKLRRKNLCSVLLAGVLGVIYVLSWFLPLEESFLTFPTIEEAFHYNREEDISLILEGKESAMVISRTLSNDAYMGTIIPKAENGWKPGTNFDKKVVYEGFPGENGGNVVVLYRYRNTSDFYLSITVSSIMNGFSDTRGTQLQNFEGPVKQKKYYSSGRYYAFVDGVDSSYVLTIDGEEIIFPHLK